MEYTKAKSRVSQQLLGEEELAAIETNSPEGLSSAEIVGIFAGRGIKFSEATFRKYVQLGLLPRSRRVGTKGKHKGSKGMYPPGTVRQINEIKQMMAQDYTIEDIRRHFVFVGGEVEELRILLKRIFGRLEEGFASDEDGAFSIAGLRREIAEAAKDAEALVQRIEETSGRLRELKQLAREAV
jgi:hypothetical protein